MTSTNSPSSAKPLASQSGSVSSTRKPTRARLASARGTSLAPAEEVEVLGVAVDAGVLAHRVGAGDHVGDPVLVEREQRRAARRDLGRASPCACGRRPDVLGEVGARPSSAASGRRARARPRRLELASLRQAENGARAASAAPCRHRQAPRRSQRHGRCDELRPGLGVPVDSRGSTADSRRRPLRPARRRHAPPVARHPRLPQHRGGRPRARRAGDRGRRAPTGRARPTSSRRSTCSPRCGRCAPASSRSWSASGSRRRAGRGPLRAAGAPSAPSPSRSTGGAREAFVDGKPVAQPRRLLRRGLGGRLHARRPGGAQGRPRRAAAPARSRGVQPLPRAPGGQPRLPARAQAAQPAAQGRGRRRAARRLQRGAGQERARGWSLRRRALVDELAPRAGAELRGHRPGRRRPRARLRARRRSRRGGARATRRLAAEALLAALRRRTALDVERGFTSVGPHTDDLDLALGGRPARTFASQGQQRAIVLALRDRGDREPARERSASRRSCCSTTSPASSTRRATPS